MMSNSLRLQQVAALIAACLLSLMTGSSSQASCRRLYRVYPYAVPLTNTAPAGAVSTTNASAIGLLAPFLMDLGFDLLRQRFGRGGNDVVTQPQLPLSTTTPDVENSQITEIKRKLSEIEVLLPPPAPVVQPSVPPAPGNNGSPVVPPPPPPPKSDSPLNFFPTD